MDDKEQELLIPRTPEAEAEHQKLLKRCQDSLFLMGAIKCLVDAWLVSGGDDTEKLSLGIANVVEPIIRAKLKAMGWTPPCNGTGEKKLDSPREKIESLTELICSATHAWLIRNISYEEFDLYDDYVTDQIIALLPYIDTRIAEMVSPDEAREAIKDARELERNRIFPKDFYPTHLRSWANQLEREYDYPNANIVIFLRKLADNWQALKEE